MGEIFVTYNGNLLSPTPLVSQSYQFLDYPLRWGNVLQVDLNGFFTGITSDIQGSIALFTNVFTGQFGTLQVIESGNPTPIYSWSNCVIENISFPDNAFHPGSFTKYSVKLHSYNVPSGVIEPVNEYSFSLGDDGNTTIKHRISAKGVKNSNGALNNAVAFVRAFTGRNPFPPAFIPDGTGVLMSVSEVIDRAASQYTVNETYKNNTGVSQPYMDTFTLNISDIVDNDFLTVEGSLKIQGSPINNNFPQLETMLSSFSIPNRIIGMGFDPTLFAQSSMNIVKDTGACSLDIRASYISGYSIQDVQGYFDYSVSLSLDEVLPKETWKVDGEFICKGPLDYKIQQLNSFKTANSPQWFGYLSGLIQSSPIFSQYHNSANTMSLLGDINIQESTGLGNFRISMTTQDGQERFGLGANPKYNVEVTPQKWNYDLIPASNIEGHYIVQDPQMMNRGRVKIDLSSEVTGDNSLSQFVLSGVITEIQNVYLATGVLINVLIETGLTDMSYSREWIGTDTQSTGLLYTKVVGSTVYDHFERAGGFLFGY